MTYHLFKLAKRFRQLPYGLVVRIRRSHRRGPGSIPGVGRTIFLLFTIFTVTWAKSFRNYVIAIFFCAGLNLSSSF